jgi:hypothetical protein
MNMKVNLECGTNFLVGYKNIDSNPQHKLVEKGSFRDLTSLKVTDDSVEELNIGSALEKIHMSEIGQILGHWKQKLKVGGRLYIKSLDANLIGTALCYDQVSLDEANKNLFGNPATPNKGLYSLTTMEIFLQRAGFKTIEKGLTGFQFFIEVEKS